MSFKVSAAPFHFWTPDVYDGAPTVFTSFMATIVKAAAFIAFIRLFDEAFGNIAIKMAVISGYHYSGNIIDWKYHSRISTKCKKNACLFQHFPGRFYDVFIICHEHRCQRRTCCYILQLIVLRPLVFLLILIKMNDYTFEGFNGFAKQQPLLAATTTIFLIIPGRHSTYSRISF